MSKFKIFNEQSIEVEAPSLGRIYELFHGFKPGSLSFITGPNGSGKSMLALNAAFAAGIAGNNVIVFSSEGNLDHRFEQRHLEGPFKLQAADIKVIEFRTLQAVSNTLHDAMKIRDHKKIVAIIDSADAGINHDRNTYVGLHNLALTLGISIVICTRCGYYGPISEQSISIVPNFTYSADIIISIKSHNGNKMQLQTVKDKFGGCRDLELEYDPKHVSVW